MAKSVKSRPEERWQVAIPVIAFVAMLLVALLPYASMGRDAVVIAHDHLDANFVWATVLAQEGQIFADGNEIVAPILGGIERKYFGSSAYLYYWLFAIFSPFYALVANEVIMRSVAFVGLFLFARSLVRVPEPGLTPHQAELQLALVAIASLAAAAFALLPFWPTTGAAVAGVPWFFWAALEFRNGDASRVSLFLAVLGVVLFVFYGSFAASGVFALAFLFLLAAIDAIRRDWARARRLLFFNLAVLALFVLQNIGLFGIFGGGEPTTRDEIVFRTFSSDRLIAEMWKSFIAGQYHAPPGTAWPMFTAVLAALSIAAVCAIRGRQKIRAVASEFSMILIGLALLALTAAAYALSRWTDFQMLIQALPAFNFGRFHWLQSGLWAIVFVAALAVICKGIQVLWPKTRRFAGLAVGASLAIVITVAQLIITVGNLPAYSSPIGYFARFDDFFAKPIFDDVRRRLGPDVEGVRLGVIGMHPAVAQFNGFKTVGGYVPVYPLRTKYAFREIIAPELAKQPKLEQKFDTWGSRAYLFVAETSHCGSTICPPKKTPSSISVDYDIDAFRSFGGTHILSASEIKNSDALGLEPLGAFTMTDSSNTQERVYFLYAIPAKS